MDWHEEYQKKLVTADEAVKVVKSGDRVVFPTGREPEALGLALAARKEELQNIELFVSTVGMDFGWYDAGWEDSFNIKTRYVAPRGHAREWADERRGDFVPCPSGLYTRGEWERQGEIQRPDVTIVEVSPPDKHGFCSFGASVWDKKELANLAKITLAEVNEKLIRTYGDNFISVSQIDYFVEHTPSGGWGRKGMYEDVSPKVKQIAAYISELVKDGDTIQIGLGGLTFPLVLAGAFDDRKDLGIHCESLPPYTSRLVKKGIATGKYKTLNPGKVVCTAAGGPREDMEFYNENPMIELYGSSYVNNIKVIAAHDNMVTMNQALAIDLTGQIVCEGLGTRMYAGTGGQIDFPIGAALSKGGRNITVLNSTGEGGKISRIMPLLPLGTPVVVLRQFADYVVTEFGIARLWGKSFRQRVQELISVAHPDFKGELKKEAEKLYWP